MEDTQFRETAKIAVGPNVEGLEQQAVAAQQVEEAEEADSSADVGVTTAEPNPES